MATLGLELPYCSDSDDTDGPPPPKRACIEPDKEADGKADEEIDQDDFCWGILRGTNNYFDFFN